MAACFTSSPGLRLPAGSSQAHRPMACRYWRTRTISPASVTGTITTDPGWRTTSASRSWPFGSVIDSICTVKIRPWYSLRISRATIGLVIISILPPWKVVEHALQVLGQRRDELHAAPVARMLEYEPRGVKERPGEPLHGVDVAQHASMHPAVHRVADDRMSDRAQVDPDLMRPPGMDGHLT